MSEPNYSINYSARRYGSTVVARGNILIPVEDATQYYTVATTANRNGRRSAAVALEYVGGNSSGGTVSIQEAGTISAEISGLSAGSASWVRCSSTGTFERCTPGNDDDIVGWAEADGRVRLMFGMVTSDIVLNQSLNGVQLETTDTPSDGEGWFKDPVTGKYRAERPLEPAKLSVKQKRFGAVGNGTTDDTTAINNCIAAANALGEPCIVLFPPGRYKVTSQLTTPAPYVSLWGAADRGTATIESYVTDTLLYLAEENDSQIACYLSVQDLDFECKVNSTPAVFDTDAGAGLEIRGGGKIQIINCNFVNFPIGICLDGAIEVHIDHCLVYSSGAGYSGSTTNGKGIWLVDGGRRGRGFNVGGAVNCNQIKHCWLGGNKNDIEVNGGLSNQIEDVIFASVGTAGLSAIRLTTTDGIDIFACECEGYGGSGSRGIVIGGAVYGATIRKNYLSAECPIGTASPGVLYKSSIVDNTLNPTSTNPAVYKWDASSMPYLVCTGNSHNGAGSFTNYDGGDAALGFNTGPTTQKGLSINKISPANAVIDAYLADATSWLRYSAYGDHIRYDLSSSSAQKQNLERFFPSLATVNACVDGQFIETGQRASGAGSSNACLSTAIPVDTVVTARWTVVQHKDGALTTYGSWIYEQDVYRNGSGSLTFVGSPVDVKGGGAVNTGSTFTAPTLVDGGSNKLAIALSGVSGTASIFFAKLEIFACVR